MPEVQCKSVDSLDYFPLAVDNHWTYAWFEDTTYKSECSVFDTGRVAGRIYYLHSGPTLGFIGNWSSPVDSLCLDSLFRVWRREKGQEYMLFDFVHGSYPSYTTYPELDTVRVTYGLDITVPAGHFVNCVDLYFRRSFGDESIGYVFAPGVGIVRYYGPFYGTHNLLRASINGKLITSVGPKFAKVPVEFVLEQNYPNPFNPTTTIKFELPKSSQVRLSVYDMLGREVSLLVNEKREAGVHEVKFDASKLASGVYFYRMQAGDFVLTRKLLLLR
jgi:hypothetical protein